MWIATLYGVLNLDFVQEVEVQDNGDAHFYTYTNPNRNYLTINLGSDKAAAMEGLRQLTRAFDASRFS